MDGGSGYNPDLILLNVQFWRVLQTAGCFLLQKCSEFYFLKTYKSWNKYFKWRLVLSCSSNSSLCPATIYCSSITFTVSSDGFNKLVFLFCFLLFHKRIFISLLVERWSCPSPTSLAQTWFWFPPASTQWTDTPPLWEVTKSHPNVSSDSSHQSCFYSIFMFFLPNSLFACLSQGCSNRWNLGKRILNILRL